MSDYINNEIPVADGVTYGVPPNTTTLYPWMSIKAGNISYFNGIEMRGDLYDKRGNQIVGSTTTGIHNSTSVLIAKDVTNLYVLTPISGEIDFLPTTGTLQIHNVGTTSETCVAANPFTFTGPLDKPTLFNLNMNYKAEISAVQTTILQLRLIYSASPSGSSVSVLGPKFSVGVQGTYNNISASFLLPAQPFPGSTGTTILQVLNIDPLSSVSIIIDYCEMTAQILDPTV